MSLAYFKNKKSVQKMSETAGFLKVVAEENRLKILYILKDGEKCVCEIWQYLDLPQNLTSHHLKILKDFGLIISRKDGLKVFYFLNEKTVNTKIKLLINYLQ